MPHCLDQTDQLALICSNLQVANSEWPAEERQRALALMQNSPEAGAGRVAVDEELEVEVRKMQHRGGGKGLLQCRKRVLSLGCPQEGVLAQEAGQRRRNSAIVLDEAPVVSREAEEASKTTG